SLPFEPPRQLRVKLERLAQGSLPPQPQPPPNRRSAAQPRLWSPRPKRAVRAPCRETRPRRFARRPISLGGDPPNSRRVRLTRDDQPDAGGDAECCRSRRGGSPRRYRSQAEPRPKRDENDRDADCPDGAGENRALMNARGRTLDGGLGNDNFSANHFCCLSEIV